MILNEPDISVNSKNYNESLKVRPRFTVCKKYALWTDIDFHSEMAGLVGQLAQ